MKVYIYIDVASLPLFFYINLNIFYFPHLI